MHTSRDRGGEICLRGGLHAIRCGPRRRDRENRRQGAERQHGILQKGRGDGRRHPPRRDGARAGGVSSRVPKGRSGEMHSVHEHGTMRDVRRRDILERNFESRVRLFLPPARGESIGSWRIRHRHTRFVRTVCPSGGQGYGSGRSPAARGGVDCARRLRGVAEMSTILVGETTTCKTRK